MRTFIVHIELIIYGCLEELSCALCLHCLKNCRFSHHDFVVAGGLLSKRKIEYLGVNGNLKDIMSASSGRP